jgi:glycosyltransferase involved in cell wall biosynthesis
VNILMVSPLDIFPPNTGGMSRIYNMAKYLMRRHQVTLVCPRLSHPEANDLPIELYPIAQPGRLQFVSPLYVWRLHSVIRQTSPELIISCFMWPMLPLALARFPRRTPLHLDTHNVESHRFRLAGSRSWRLMALYERLALRLADRVYLVSEDDRERLQALGMPFGKSQLVPNGYDDERFRPDPAAGAAMRRALGVPEDELLFLYFGHLQYAPNVEGLEILHREILRRLDERGLRYRIAIAGRGADELARSLHHPRLLFAGVVDQIENLINAADAVVAPLLRGGGTRIKIIESIACGRPVVSTSVGAEGLDRVACGGLLDVVDDWDAFACAMAAAASRPAAAVPAVFREQYAWSAIVSRMGLDTPEMNDAVRAR